MSQNNYYDLNASSYPHHHQLNGNGNGTTSASAYASTSSASLDVDSTSSSSAWALPHLGATAPTTSSSSSFFTSNHSLVTPQEEQGYDLSTGAGAGHYSALPEFELQDGGVSEAGSSYSRGGRARKRPNKGVGGESGVMSWEGGEEESEGGSSTKGAAGRKTSKAKGKGKRKADTPEEEASEPGGGAAPGVNLKKPKVKQKKAPGDKKKKAGRACAACQKAHLTCDDGQFVSHFGVCFPLGSLTVSGLAQLDPALGVSRKAYPRLAKMVRARRPST